MKACQKRAFLYICGTMGVRRKTEWTEKKAQNVLRKYFLSENTKKYEITNLYVYGWESDYLVITRSNISYEIEIKISRADFKNDFKNKEDKHLLFEGGNKLGKFSKAGGMPNYFYYAVPDGLINADEVPDYAGLLYLQPWGVTFEKEAKKLTNEKFDPDKMNLVDKFYYNMLSWQRKYEEVIDSAETIKDLKRQLKGVNKTFNDYEELIGNKDWEISDLKDEIKKLKNEIERRDNQDSERNMLEK